MDTFEIGTTYRMDMFVRFTGRITIIIEFRDIRTKMGETYGNIKQKALMLYILWEILR